ncbi:MAG TPA: ABC transporter ATP-binding protein, partial [Oceanospirillaceae bacterium]|nr:ABC transporter ATP-binding protein [Oceanospirillaceae bacterium]
MLKVDGISRTYGDLKVVDKLSFNVNEGEFVALLGPSGCGKSTSLKMIAGLEKPDEGSIELDGRDI